MSFLLLSSGLAGQDHRAVGGDKISARALATLPTTHTGLSGGAPTPPEPVGAAFQ
ncbi:MAG: hypothetical protein IRZ31_12800 [Thermogemmatispora sp.]|uniref:hypothetical protein n=1 Tax=Thermogemmatispora TaxID=768669 RepID=UPI001CB9C50D|nr:MULTISPECIES: hypothetical protein [Thermogemmatispora]MBX5457772.1 hypothetical protein [Thermogemmatispora sp.]